MILDRLDRSFSALAFARHVPPRRMAVRLLRRLQQRGGAIAKVRPGPARLVEAGSMPFPVFPPRPIEAAYAERCWRFCFLGVVRQFAGAIDWNPEDPALGQLWRMNLHYMEYLEVLPVPAALGAIRAWIEANPPERPGAHYDAWNGYALSLRTVCWMQWLARHGAAIDADSRAVMAASLARQLAVLARFPETDLGGNHLIKNVKALLWGAAAFEGAGARKWGEIGRALLRSEIDHQVLADGVHFERSPSYHAQVAADLIECAAVLDGVGRAALAPRIVAMVGAAQALSHPDGAVAQFNDAGLTMAYPAAALAAASGAANGAASAATIFPDAGFASLRLPGFSTFVKFGPIGADDLPAHAHGDIGSIELSWAGQRVIVDQGVFEYVEGPRRSASRAAANHNVTAPQNGDMADFFGAFRCGWRPHAYVLRAQADGDTIEVVVAHNGFSHGRVAHCNIVERSLVATAERVMVTDRLSAGAGIGWASRFLLHPQWACRVHADGLELEREGQRLILRCAIPVRLENAVWWPDMGSEVETRRIVIDWPAGSKELAMVFAQA